MLRAIVPVIFRMRYHRARIVLKRDEAKESLKFDVIREQDSTVLLSNFDILEYFGIAFHETTIYETKPFLKYKRNVQRMADEASERGYRAMVLIINNPCGASLLRLIRFHRRVKVFKLRTGGKMRERAPVSLKTLKVDKMLFRHRNGTPYQIAVTRTSHSHFSNS